MNKRFDSPIRVYADTSVFGAIIDAEYFAAPSNAFFEMVRSGAFSLIISPTLEDEIKGAPTSVRDLFLQIKENAEIIEESDAVVELREAYIRHGIVSAKWKADALHVASGTVSHCKIIVSWNMKHIVNFRRIRLYNAVNLLHGYDAIAIHTPAEVLENE